MANFTKAPWKATRVAPFSYQVTTDHPRGHANFGIIVREVRSQENAQLIAAAPELFDALEALLDITPFATNDRDKEIRFAARTALRKAKGEPR